MYIYICDKALQKSRGMISRKWWTVVPFVEELNKRVFQSGFGSMGLIYFLKCIIGIQELIELLSFLLMFEIFYNKLNILYVTYEPGEHPGPWFVGYHRQDLWYFLNQSVKLSVIWIPAAVSGCWTPYPPTTSFFTSFLKPPTLAFVISRGMHY